MYLQLKSTDTKRALECAFWMFSFHWSERIVYEKNNALPMP